MDATDGRSNSSRWTPQIRELAKRRASNRSGSRTSRAVPSAAMRSHHGPPLSPPASRSKGLQPHRSVFAAAEVHIPRQVTREFVRLPLNPLGHLIQEPKTVLRGEPGCDISRQLGLPQRKHRCGKLSRADLGEGNGRQVDRGHLGTRSVETTQLIPHPIVHAHEILAAGSPQPIPQGKPTVAPDEIAGGIVQRVAQRDEVSNPSGLRIERDQVGSQERETELQHTLRHRPARAGHDDLAAEPGCSDRGGQHAHAGPNTAGREGLRPQGDLRPVRVRS